MRLRRSHSLLGAGVEPVRDAAMSVLGAKRTSIGGFYGGVRHSLRDRLSIEQIDFGISECESREIIYVGPDWVEMLAPLY